VHRCTSSQVHPCTLLTVPHSRTASAPS
jgi:hypothetical protein